MTLPPMPTPNIPRLDDLVRSSLEEFKAQCFSWLLIATVLVALGLLLEAPEIWHESVKALRKLFSKLFRSATPEREAHPLMKLAGTLGWFLIVIGVTGEFVLDDVVSRADGFVKKFDEIILADAENRSSSANEHANAAYERAAQTEKEAAERNEHAAKTEQLAQEERARAAKALEAAEVARKEAEGFQLQIAQANEKAANANRIAEQERLERLQLEARLADRILLPAQEQSLRAAFARLKGKTVDVSVFGDTVEIASFSEKIMACMRYAGVLIYLRYPIGTVQGVFVGAKADGPQEFKDVAVDFIAILKPSLGDGVRPADFDQLIFRGGRLSQTTADPNSPLRIFIGAK